LPMAAVARGDLPGAYLDADFLAPTGYEQYAVSERSQPFLRDTYSVRVVIRHDGSPIVLLSTLEKWATAVLNEDGTLVTAW
jgi:hypothetical protein